jgi:hypothetical protein
MLWAGGLAEAGALACDPVCGPSAVEGMRVGSKILASRRLLICLYTWCFLSAGVVIDELIWRPCPWVFSCVVGCVRHAARCSVLPQGCKIPCHQCTAVLLIMLSLVGTSGASATAVRDFEAHMDPGVYSDEVSWRMGEAGTAYDYSASPRTVSLEAGKHTLYMLDSYGDGWNAAAWTLKDIGGDAVVAGPFTLPSGALGSETFTAWGQVTACPAGSRLIEQTTTGDSNTTWRTCEHCPVGYVQPVSDSTSECGECPVGTYQPATGSTSCESVCPRNDDGSRRYVHCTGF